MHCGYRVERRKYQRLRVSLSVLYTVEGPLDISWLMGNREFEAKTFDLSEGGVSLLTEHYLPVDTKLKIKIIVFESDRNGSVKFHKPLELSGEVRSSFFSGKNNEYRLGICFKNVAAMKRRRISDFLYSPLRLSVQT